MRLTTTDEIMPSVDCFDHGSNAVFSQSLRGIAQVRDKNIFCSLSIPSRFDDPGNCMNAVAPHGLAISHGCLEILPEFSLAPRQRGNATLAAVPVTRLCIE